MTPNTFEGYTFTGAYGGKDGAPGFIYGFGWIDKIKPRNSDRFISMSQAAGAEVNRGVVVGGGKVSYKGLTYGAVNYYSDDIINIFYTEGSFKLPKLPWTDRICRSRCRFVCRCHRMYSGHGSNQIYQWDRQAPRK